MLAALSKPYRGFMTGLNEDQVLQAASFMKAHLLDLGYEYIIIPLGWYSAKPASPFEPVFTDDYSRLIPSPVRFPSSKSSKGFGPLASKLHSMGLKLGLEIMHGIARQCVYKGSAIMESESTASDIARAFPACSWNADCYGVDPHRSGAFEYYQSLIDLYESWGVDLIRVEDVLEGSLDEAALLVDSIEQRQTDMVLSLGSSDAFLELADELVDNNGAFSIAHRSCSSYSDIVHALDKASSWAAFRRPGCLLDCGFIKPGMDPVELQTAMRFWSLMGSPMIIDADPSALDKATLKILSDRFLLELHKSGQCPRQTCDTGKLRIWMAELNGSSITALFNTSEEAISLKYSGKAYDWQQNLLSSDPVVQLASHQSAIYEARS
ncbi:MAG: hypothetical protein PHI83_00550 [Sphaerochaetaceae bacterium]|jgi:alpha-galactosidase|nr:hypothetical protein [Sphaerochaetaceae bacterium]